MNTFTKKAEAVLGKHYEYGLVDPRNNEIFFRGVGSQDQIFNHEVNGDNDPKNKLDRINEIKEAGYEVVRVIINKEMDEGLMDATQSWCQFLENGDVKYYLDNCFYDEDVRVAYTVDEFNKFYGAEELEEVKNNVLVLRAEKLFRDDTDGQQLYEAVRGIYKLDQYKLKKVEYVLVVCRCVVVAVYKPTKWCVCKDAVDCMPKGVELTQENENRLFFVDESFTAGLPLDDNQVYYLNKSVKNLNVKLSSQHPFTYLKPEK